MKKISLSSRNEIDESVLGASAEERANLDAPFRRRNLGWLVAATVLVFAIFFARTGYLAIVRGEHYEDVSRGNTVRVIPIEAPRGNIFDRKGEQLVYNIPSTNVILLPSRDHSELSGEAYGTIMDIFDISRETMDAALAKRRESPASRILLAEHVDRDAILRFSEHETAFPDIALAQSVTRHYEDSTIFSHIIGYESAISKDDLDNPLYEGYLLTDSVGRQGLEKSYERYLRGAHGARRVETDALGRVKREISSETPIAGNDIITSIDADLQKVLFDAMRDELSSAELTRAAAVAMDPRTGEVLALASFPSYDNNAFSKRNTEAYASIVGDADQPLFNRATSGEYPPASTVKPILAAAALETGVVAPETEIESRGGITVGSTFFGDWKAHGFTDVREAIAVSSDVYFYSVGGGYGSVRGMGIDTMRSYEERFGFGAPTGIDLPGESDGLIPNALWKEDVLGERWYVGNTYHASIGQGYTRATPIQVAVATAAIANGGVWHEPRVVSYIRSPEGDVAERIKGDRHETGVSEELLRIVREGMRMTVTEGTAMGLNSLDVEVAGKTGTAEFGVEGKTHGWFASFAPYEDPEIVLVVLVERQEDDGYHAVPITKRVYEAYFEEEENEEDGEEEKNENENEE